MQPREALVIPAVSDCQRDAPTLMGPGAAANRTISLAPRAKARVQGVENEGDSPWIAHHTMRATAAPLQRH